MKDFIGTQVPHYAILSHTWADDEVSFQQYQSKECYSLAGYRKITSFCALAAEKGLEWGWIDTCCIDKSSSAELSEAINSMFSWYKDSRFSAAYLNDMPTVEWEPNLDQPSSIQRMTSSSLQHFKASRWFRRGWTLQELLAPYEVYFYDQNWSVIGKKTAISDPIASITGIDELILRIGNYQRASVAEKMSWAAGRQTTRSEDRAYSLLGLFGVNMPLLYGEGAKAFDRLQLEILQATSDESIFAWANDDLWTSGMLAKSPDDFALSGEIWPLGDDRAYRTPYYMTNRGLHIELGLIPVNNGALESNIFEAPIHCSKWVGEEQKEEHWVRLRFQTLETHKKGQLHVVRIGCHDLNVTPIAEASTPDQEAEVEQVDNMTPVIVCPIDIEKSSTSTSTDVQWSPETLHPGNECLQIRVAGKPPAEDIQMPRNIQTGQCTMRLNIPQSWSGYTSEKYDLTLLWDKSGDRDEMIKIQFPNKGTVKQKRSTRRSERQSLRSRVKGPSEYHFQAGDTYMVKLKSWGDYPLPFFMSMRKGSNLHPDQILFDFDLTDYDDNIHVFSLPSINVT